jgi:hypothetical protein
VFDLIQSVFQNWTCFFVTWAKKIRANEKTTLNKQKNVSTIILKVRYNIPKQTKNRNGEVSTSERLGEMRGKVKARLGEIWRDLARFGEIWRDLARFATITCNK